jgi:serine/threonine protein kinase
MGNIDTYDSELCSIHCRPPELLAEWKKGLKPESLAMYCNKVDVWSLGCVFAECIIGYRFEILENLSIRVPFSKVTILNLLYGTL